jgi:hypothetical protein
MTFDQFITKWLGKKADYDGHYAGQCVDLFRFYVKEVLNRPQPRSVKGARDFWFKFEQDPNLRNFYTRIPNTITTVPRRRCKMRREWAHEREARRGAIPR